MNVFVKEVGRFINRLVQNNMEVEQYRKRNSIVKLFDWPQFARSLLAAEI